MIDIYVDLFNEQIEAKLEDPLKYFKPYNIVDYLPDLADWNNDERSAAVYIKREAIDPSLKIFRLISSLSKDEPKEYVYTLDEKVALDNNGVEVTDPNEDVIVEVVFQKCGRIDYDWNDTGIEILKICLSDLNFEPIDITKYVNKTTVNALIDASNRLVDFEIDSDY